MEIWIDRNGKLRTCPRPAPSRFRELSLERGSELPWFPRYQVLVHADGRVEWEGREVVAVVGSRTWNISSEQVEALQKLVQQASFAAYEDGGPRFRNETPLPTIRIVFEDGDEVRANTLRDWRDPSAAAAALQWFNLLADAIDETIGTAPYVWGQLPASKRAMSFRSLTLERGGCFGDCPIYAVNVDLAGRVDWIGEIFVKASGEHSWTVSADVVEKLRQALVRAKFTDLQDRYDAPGVTDASSATITVQLANGRTKRVYHYHGYWSDSAEDGEIIQRLLWLENRIDRLLGTREYVGKRSM